MDRRYPRKELCLAVVLEILLFKKYFFKEKYFDIMKCMMKNNKEPCRLGM